jgi:hypothetical protein
MVTIKANNFKSSLMSYILDYELYNESIAE